MITSVHAMSTGNMWLRPRHLLRGRVPALAWMAASRAWTPPLPVYCFLIEHRDGTVMFDLGQSRQIVTDPEKYFYVGGAIGALHRRVARFAIDHDETLPALLAARGHRLAQIDTVILSHFHQDHVGGLRDMSAQSSGAAIYAGADELDLLGARNPEVHGVLARHIDLPGLNWHGVGYRPASPDLRPFREAFDVFGDEGVTLLPTPGHTPGSLTALLRSPRRTPLLLVGDATFADEYLRRGEIPGVGNGALMRETSGRLLELAHRLGAVVLPAHDPTSARRLEEAWP